MQKDKELLLKDLCARLPYGVKCQFEDTVRIIDGESSPFYDYMLAARHLDLFINNKDFYVKPYLRTMSSMTEEEAKEIATLHGLKNILSVKIADEYIDVIIDDGFCSTGIRTIWYDEIISSIDVFNWLNKNMFDYRGLNGYCS